jgi:uncharacterized ferritin-like protein (DUF455 family)
MRLVLMQIQTEGAAVGSIKKRLKTPLALSSESVRIAFEVDLRDEISHTMLGRRWLQFLYPNSGDRKKVMETADVMRSIVIASAFSIRGGMNLSNVLDSALLRSEPAEFSTYPPAKPGALLSEPLKAALQGR